MFKMKKWYFDFLTPDNSYAFVYFAYVSVFGFTKGSFTIHCSREGKGSPLSRTFNVDFRIQGDDESPVHTIQLPGGTIVIGEDQCLISFVRDGASVNLRFASRGQSNVSPVIIQTGGKSRIIWKPIGLRYDVSGGITLGQETISAEGSTGYADVLQSSFLPLAVPVRTLYWGRMHRHDINAVYIQASDLQKKRTWSKLYAMNGDLLTESNDVSILDVRAGTYELVGGNHAARIRLTVRRVKPVQEMGFIDQQEIRSSLVRSLVKFLTRNPRSTKFLSYADIQFESAENSRAERGIPMIDEFALL